MQKSCFVLLILILFAVGCQASKAPAEIGKPAIPASIVYATDSVTGKQFPQECSYDATRDKLAIIIKQDGYYDSQDTISMFNQYFAAVQDHLGISSAGVQRFSESVEDFDHFIEGLIENEHVGYAIIVGMDLPVTMKDNQRTLLDLVKVNDEYPYLKQKNGCNDIALSFVFAPASFDIQQKRDFVIGVFSRFRDYHRQFEATIQQFNGRILFTAWNDSLPGLRLGLDKKDIMDTYANTKFFYPVDFVWNSNNEEMNRKVKEKPLIWMFNVHGAPRELGLGFKDPAAGEAYTTNEDIVKFAGSYGSPALFINPDAACQQDVIDDGRGQFCCWPQTWLRSGVWTVMEVVGEEHGNYFEKSLYEGKIVGNALKKTYHNQAMIYGDILAAVP